jgi:hypothetical protein
MEQLLYIRVRGKVQGPFSPEKLQAMARRGQFSRLHEVSEDGKKWVRASTYPDLFVASASGPPQRVVAPAPGRQASSPAVRTAEAYSVRLPDELPSAKDPPPASPREQSWYYAAGSTQQGPVGFAMLQTLASSGQIAPDDLVWSDGMLDWTPAWKVPGLLRSPAAPPAAPTTAAMPEAATPARASKLAIASLVAGILGLLPLLGVGSLAAVVLGHVSLAKIRRSNGTLIGRGMALAGLILGYVVLVLLAAYVLFLLVRVVFGGVAGGAGAAPP